MPTVLWTWQRTNVDEWTVGAYDDDNVWHPHKTFDNPRSAAWHAHSLNGGNVPWLAAEA